MVPHHLSKMWWRCRVVDISWSQQSRIWWKWEKIFFCMCWFYRVHATVVTDQNLWRQNYFSVLLLWWFFWNRCIRHDHKQYCLSSLDPLPTWTYVGLIMVELKYIKAFPENKQYSGLKFTVVSWFFYLLPCVLVLFPLDRKIAFLECKMRWHSIRAIVITNPISPDLFLNRVVP